MPHTSRPLGSRKTTSRRSRSPNIRARDGAVWRIEVENFPAFIVVDDKGNDFFKELNLG
jgi:hypothetical protein